MPLQSKTPEKKNKRIKMLMFGPAGIGKTTCCIQWPNAVIVDMERGTDNYAETIKKSGSVVLQTTNPEDLKKELKALLTEKHPYTCLVIDPLTLLYQAIQEKWTRIFEKWTEGEKNTEMQDFGFRYWAKVKSEYKSIMRLLLALDMSVLCTSHQKDVYGDGMKKVGLGSDSMRGDEYLFDYIFQLQQQGPRRMALVRKERAELGANKFPAEFEWSYANFVKFYGQEAIERPSAPVVMASGDQLTEINVLLQTVAIPKEDVQKWMDKADVDDFSEMTGDQIQKCIDHVRKKLQPLTGGK